MASKTKKFDMFGVTYRTRQFPAVRALELVNAETIDPLDMLSQTEVLVGDAWIALDDREPINQYVTDRIGIIPPRQVLGALMKIVGEHSCGAMNGWVGVKVPNRFTPSAQGMTTRRSAHVDPIIETLIAHEAATLRELEEYYSIEDALKMLDVIVAKGVNEALANEAAQKNARRK
jgi:hypothetical protein